VIHTGPGPWIRHKAFTAWLIVMFVEPMLVVALFGPFIDVLVDWLKGCADAEEPRQLIKIKMTPAFVARTYLFIA